MKIKVTVLGFTKNNTVRGTVFDRDEEGLVANFWAGLIRGDLLKFRFFELSKFKTGFESGKKQKEILKQFESPAILQDIATQVAKLKEEQKTKQ